MTRDPFVRRLIVAVTLTTAGVGVAPLVSDLGVIPADGPGTLVWLALSLFGVVYLAILAVSLAWMVLRPRLSTPTGETD